MSAQTPENIAFPLNTYTRRTVRAWWADGLWDFAMAGFFVLAAIWIYVLVRISGFPSWTWPWPFITHETINPLQREVLLWMIGIVIVGAAYLWVANWLVTLLKRRFIAPRTGDVRFSFMLPIEHRMWYLYLGAGLIGCLALTGLYWFLKNGPHFFSVLCSVWPAAILFVIGKTYDLSRYRWVAGIGLSISFLIELLTTNAEYLRGPVNFLDVSVLYGNPAIPFLVWIVLLLISGCVGLRNTLRLPHAPRA